MDQWTNSFRLAKIVHTPLANSARLFNCLDHDGTERSNSLPMVLFPRTNANGHRSQFIGE
jgi:hypothetical protein